MSNFHLQLITDSMATPDLKAGLSEALQGGVDCIQVREKSAPASALFDLACQTRQLCDMTGAGLIVNDRIDVAVAAGAHGAHLSGRSLPVSAARPLLPSGRLLGVSVHSLAEAQSAARAGVDYVTFGSVFPTSSHPGQPAAGLNVLSEVIRQDDWREYVVQENDRVEVVRAMQGGSIDDPLVIGPRTFDSRLFLGTGKYRSESDMADSLWRSGTEMVTVAIRYMDLGDNSGSDILRHIDRSRCELLPNTAGAYTADQAVKMALLAREALGTNWIKLEVIGDHQTLLPDLQGTLEAARRLVQEGFVVLPYTTTDLITCLRLEDAGCAAVMPLAAPIGSGQGLVDWTAIRRVIERVKVPVVVDAGIGCPTDARRAMELGAAAVLVNTAIAKAQKAPMMAEAMKNSVVAGRQGFLAGRMPVFDQANPSSPTQGVPAAPIRKTGEVE